MVVHNTFPRERVSSLFRRIKSRFHLGLGQVIRYRLHKGLPAKTFLAGTGRPLEFSAWLLAGALATLLAMLTKHRSVLLLWSILSALLLLAFAAKGRSLIKPFRYAIIWLVQAYSIFRGFMTKPVCPSSYPTNPIVIKEPCQILVPEFNAGQPPLQAASDARTKLD